MSKYCVKDPAGKPLKCKAIPIHFGKHRDSDEVATWSRKVMAKRVRNYMGGGAPGLSSEAGFTVSKVKNG